MTLWQHEGRITKMALEVVMRSKEMPQKQGMATHYAEQSLDDGEIVRGTLTP